ncbi:MAG TPA: YqgE/AlgH family protein [Candidatus Sulfotelmatobacter sp.]|nr:YqgE/AlgH family protein [Candidatus Sulfotelmatobacter sp.]
MALRQMAGVGAMGGALALALAVSGANLRTPAAEGQQSGALSGQLLVATPEMNDPRFTHTVIYMVQHDAGGAMGLIVNRPFKEIPIALLLDRLGLEGKGAGGSIRMHFGGPVDPEQVFILHTADFKTGETHVLGNGIAVTAPPAILRAIGAGAGPRRSLLALGYAGWAPGQLEGEIQVGAWVSVPADAALVFDDTYDTKWERAMARRKIDL